MFEKKKNNGLIFREVLQQDIENIRKTLENINYESFNAIVETILEARRVYIVGLRALASLAEMLGFMLNHILSDIKVLRHGDSEMFEGMKDLTGKDVMIAFSFPRYTRRTIEALNYAKQCNAKTIAITDKIISPAAQVADFVLISKIDMVSFNNSYVAPMSLINALTIALSMKDSVRILASLNKMEEILQEYDFWS
jgi:DNA-binding MurR/RpiR family transcriptional regulator